MTNIINRRAVLTALPAAALAPAAMAVHAADPLPGWLREWREKRDAWANHPDDDSAEAEALWADRTRLDDLIAEAAPTTPEGIAAQIEWVLEDSGGDLPFEGHRLALEKALAGLKQGAA